MRKLFLFLACIAFCTGTSGIGHAKEPIRIGVIQPLTGQGSYVGKNFMDGIYLAQDIINEKGGLLGGRPVELVVEDDQCIPGQSVAATKKIIYQDKVKIMLGAMCSSATIADIPVAKDAGIIHVVPTSYAPAITEKLGHKNLFRTCINSNIISNGFSRFLAKDLGLKTIAILAVNDDFGRDQAKLFTEKFKEYGNPKVVGTYFFDFKDRDFSTLLTKIKSVKPQGLYIIARTPQNAMILNQMGDLGMVGDYVVAGSTNFSSAGCREKAGKNAEGLHSAVMWDTSIKTPASQAYMDAYKKKYGKLPEEEFSCSGYRGLMITADAIERAGTADDVHKLRKAFEATEWQGPSGTIVFDEKHQASVPCHVIKVENGKTKLVK